MKDKETSLLRESGNFHSVPLFNLLFVLTGCETALCEVRGKTQVVEMYTLKHCK